MQGLIFVELEKFVRHIVGPDAWGALLERAGLAGRIYAMGSTYPDAEVAQLVAAAAAMTGSPAPEMLESFGEFIVPDLLATYRDTIRPEWKTLDLLAHTEEAIHTAVRRQNPGAEPPRLKARRASADEVVIAYASRRRLCSIAKGITRGIARHYGERVEVTETQCMNSGAPACILSVRRLD